MNTNKKIQQRTIITKEKLLNSAKELFLTKGYYNTNTNEIAKNAGISTGNFYNHFKDKMDIYICLSEDYFSKLNTLLNTFIEMFATTTDLELLVKEFINKYISLNSTEGCIFKDFHLLMNENDTLKDIHSKLNNTLKDSLMKIIKDSNNIKLASSPESITWILSNLIVKLPLEISVFNDSEEKEKHINALTELICLYLKNIY